MFLVKLGRKIIKGVKRGKQVFWQTGLDSYDLAIYEKRDPSMRQKDPPVS